MESVGWTVTPARRPAPAGWSKRRSFGSNPGELRMLSYVPPELPPKAGLVVVLHGCTQTAAGYELGAGWSTLARRYGFALLMPEQTKANNANGSASTGSSPDDIQRGEGEARLDPRHGRADGSHPRHRPQEASSSPACPPAAR